MNKTNQVAELLRLLVETPHADVLRPHELEALGITRAPEYVHREDLRSMIADRLAGLLVSE